MATSEQKKSRLMIKGTEGNEDYLVIARQNGYVMAIKALMQIGEDGAQFGFRVRMQKADFDATTNITDLPAKEKETMASTFKNVPWGKRSLTRFSTMLTAKSSFGYDFRVQMMEECKERVGELLTEVEDKIVPTTLTDRDDALEYLYQEYEDIVKIVEAHIEQKAQGGEGTVVQFPGGDSNDIH